MSNYSISLNGHLFDPTTGEFVGVVGLDGKEKLFVSGSVATLSPLAVAMAKTKAGTADTRMLLVGDSTLFGYQAVPGTTSIPAQLATYLSKIFSFPVVNNMIIAESGTIAAGSDPRITMGSGVSRSPYGFASDTTKATSGSAWTLSSGGTLTLSYASAFSDKVRIYYVQNTGVGTLTPTVNGTALTGKATAGTPSIQFFDSTYTRAATATVAITASAGACIVLAVEFFDSTQKCLYLGNAGVATSTTTLWAQTSGISTWATTAMIAAYAPTGGAIMLGINDSTSPALDVVSYQANMTTLANQLGGTGLVDFWTFFQSDPALGKDSSQQAFISVLSTLAVQFNGRLVDIRTAMGGYSAANTAGLMSDVTHPNAAGYGLAARAVGRVYQNVGA